MHLLNKEEALEFLSHRSAYLDLAERHNPFAGAAWTTLFVEHIARDDWTFVIPESHVGGESFMLLYSEDGKLHRRAAVANYYASLYSPIISDVPPGSERGAPVRHLIEQLSGLRPACSTLQMAPLDDEAPDSHHLRAAFSDSGWYVRRYDCFGNWYLPCGALTFQSYMEGRDSRLVNTWRRKLKKFRQKHGRLQIVTEAGQVDAAMDAYEHVYALSWKQPEPHRDFIRAWAKACAERGWLRLGLAWIGDEPIASQFWFTLHDRACIFKLAYDEVHAEFSAGTLLSAHMFEHAIDQDQVDEIDYLSGDDGYKRSWMPLRRQRVGIKACNLHTMRGVASAAWERAGDLRRHFAGGVRRPDVGRDAALAPVLTDSMTADPGRATRQAVASNSDSSKVETG
jgi:hypothetical protein